MPPDEDAVVDRRGTRVDPVRAGILLVLFLVALALLLGPASNLGAPATTTPTTSHHNPIVMPQDVRVQVANGSGVPRLASSWTVALQQHNWDVLAANTATHHYAKTTIYFSRGFQYAADVLAADFNVPVSRVKPKTGHLGVEGSNSDDVVIVIGVHHGHQSYRTAVAVG